MQASKHPEYETEETRLGETQKAIDAFISGSSDHNNIGADDWSKAALDKHNFEVAELYQDFRNEPYFGRFDFQSEHASQAEKIYLGYQALNLGEYEVIDWRAPIGSLFAGSKAKNQSYHYSEGIIKGLLLLRRRYKIANNDVQQIDDEFDRRPHQARLKNARIPAVWKTEIDKGRMLVISPFKEYQKYVTKEVALKCNDLAARIARHLLIVYASEGQFGWSSGEVEVG